MIPFDLIKPSFYLKIRMIPMVFSTVFILKFYFWVIIYIQSIFPAIHIYKHFPI